jgi:hypothetical protein
MMGKGGRNSAFSFQQKKEVPGSLKTRHAELLSRRSEA